MDLYWHLCNFWMRSSVAIVGGQQQRGISNLASMVARYLSQVGDYDAYCHYPSRTLISLYLDVSFTQTMHPFKNVQNNKIFHFPHFSCSSDDPLCFVKAVSFSSYVGRGTQWSKYIQSIKCGYSNDKF